MPPTAAAKAKWSDIKRNILGYLAREKKCGLIFKSHVFSLSHIY